MQRLTETQGFSEILPQNKAPIHNKILLRTPVWDYVLQKLQMLLKKMQVAYSRPMLPESEELCWREKKAQCESLLLQWIQVPHFY